VQNGRERLLADMKQLLEQKWTQRRCDARRNSQVQPGLSIQAHGRGGLLAVCKGHLKAMNFLYITRLEHRRGLKRNACLPNNFG